MGFDGDSDSDDDTDMRLRRRLIDNEPITTEELLDGLPLWLDRLFEGSTQRYYIGYWPDFPVLNSNFHPRHHQEPQQQQQHSQHHHYPRHMHED